MFCPGDYFQQRDLGTFPPIECFIFPLFFFGEKIAMPCGASAKSYTHLLEGGICALNILHSFRGPARPLTLGANGTPGLGLWSRFICSGNGEGRGKLKGKKKKSLPKSIKLKGAGAPEFTSVGWFTYL